jgi:hypothetical protein
MSRYTMAAAAGGVAFVSASIAFLTFPHVFDSAVTVGVASAIFIGLCVGGGLSLGGRVFVDR